MDHSTDEGAPGFHGDEAVVTDFDGDDLRAGSDAVAIRVLGKMPRGDPGHLGNSEEIQTWFKLQIASLYTIAL